MPELRKYDATTSVIFQYSPIAEITNTLTEGLSALISSASPGTLLSFFVVQRPSIGPSPCDGWQAEYTEKTPDSVLARIINSRKQQYTNKQTSHYLMVELPAANSDELSELEAKIQGWLRSWARNSHPLCLTEAEKFIDDYINERFHLSMKDCASTKLVMSSLKPEVRVELDKPGALLGLFDPPVSDAFVASLSLEVTAPLEPKSIGSLWKKVTSSILTQAANKDRQEPHAWVRAQTIIFAQHERMGEVVGLTAARWRRYHIQMLPAKDGATIPAISLPISTAVHLVPVEGEQTHANSTAHGMLVETRGGQGQFIDVFAPANANFIAVGVPGTGLTGFTEQILDDLLARTGCLRILDEGRGTDHHRDVHGGKSVLLTKDHPISLNPFFGIDSESELTRRISVFTAIADAALGSELLPQFFSATIESAVRAAWTQHGPSMGFKEVFSQIERLAQTHAAARVLVDMFEQHPNSIIHPASPWLNGPPLDLSKDNFVVFEIIEALFPDPIAYRVLSTLIVLFVDIEFKAWPHDQKKLFMVLEAWNLLWHSEFAAAASLFGASASRYNGALGISTTNYACFHTHKWAWQILANAHWQFLLQQKEESLRLYTINTGVFHVSPSMMQALIAIRSYPNRHIEFAIVAEGVFGVYRYKASDYELRSTRMGYRNRQDYYSLRKKGHSALAAIDAIDVAPNCL